MQAKPSLSAWIIRLVILVALLLWSPWVTPEWAAAQVMSTFSAAWEGVVDGCGFNCAGCGTVSTQRGLFGVYVDIEYACGLIPTDSPEYHSRDRAFVTGLGTVLGLDTP